MSDLTTATTGTAQAAGSVSLAQDQADLASFVEGVVGPGLDVDLLRRALTHRSFAYENGGLPNNERLEFLGDAVLGLVVTETLYSLYPDLQEGALAKCRAAVVNMRALADVGAAVGLGGFVLLGRGEETTGGRAKASILADTLEALIGTVFLSYGVAGAATFVHHLFDELIESSVTRGAGLDWKTSLQEWASAHACGPVEYRITEDGPDHLKSFEATVVLGSESLAVGQGRTKKEAEQRAAEGSLVVLRARQAAASGPDAR